LRLLTVRGVLVAAVCGGILLLLIIGLWPEGGVQQAETILVPQRTFRHGAEVWAVAFSPDGKLLATASVDKTVKLWEVATGSLARTLTHPEGVTSVAFSPDGELLATTSYDLQVRLWRVRDGILLRTLAGHTRDPWTVAFSTIRVWRMSDGALVQAVAAHDNDVRRLAVSPDGKWAASASEDRTAILYKIMASGR
jgi:WD40 repeat protein